jgi:hypothetical protein
MKGKEIFIAAYTWFSAAILITAGIITLMSEYPVWLRLGGLMFLGGIGVCIAYLPFRYWGWADIKSVLTKGVFSVPRPVAYICLGIGLAAGLAVGGITGSFVVLSIMFLALVLFGTIANILGR